MISKTWTRGTMNCSMNCLQYKLQSRPQQKVHLCMSKAPSDEKRERPGVFIGILNFPLGQLLGTGTAICCLFKKKVGFSIRDVIQASDESPAGNFHRCSLLDAK